MQLGGFANGEREGLRDGELVVILERRVPFGASSLIGVAARRRA
jgi:hypothetical protein